MSKTINIGRVAMVARGRWRAEDRYEPLDLVCLNGALWAAKDANTGEMPSEGSTHWNIVIDNSISDGEGGVSLTIENMDIAKMANLFDKNDPDCKEDHIISNGSECTNTETNTTGYIKVKAGQPYCISNRNSNKAAVAIAQYDANKKYISMLQYDAENIYVVPDSSARYIRVSYDKRFMSSFTVENRYYPKLVGSEHTYYIPSAKVLEESAPLVFLPDVIYCTIGKTIEIYNKCICPAADNYYFRWNSNVGKAYSKKYIIKGTTAVLGYHPLTLEIYNHHGEIVYNKKVTIRIAGGEPSESRTICPIGDVYTAGKYWLDAVEEYSDRVFTFVGTVESDTGMLHEGRAGWSTTSYLYYDEDTDLENDDFMLSNPFYNGEFDWDSYSLKSSVSGVQLFFGEREIMSTSGKVIGENLCKMIDSIRSVSDIPIFVVLPPLWGPQEGMAQQRIDGAGLNFSLRNKFQYDMMFIEALSEIYDTIKSREYSDVCMVPICSCFDSDNNMESEEVKINPRSTRTEIIAKGAITPSKGGYEQMADVIFSAYCSVYREKEGFL